MAEDRDHANIINCSSEILIQFEKSLIYSFFFYQWHSFIESE